ncbi:hypothetical protein [Dyadobacter alkalitolerans]|uniref:hypothetical protein n=1 Tax=Dyadobacter alkalitolerans TaxID=492736 RepID=UPI000555E4BE|nr:hypothetical protein [Dyadobacter alkalitolerans]
MQTRRAIKACLSALLTCVFLNSAHAQNTLEFIQDGVNNSYKPPVPKGPTSIPQTLGFFLNNNGRSDAGIYFQPLQNPLLVTFSFDDQVYVAVPQHVTGLTFGAASGASATHVRAEPIVNNNFHFQDSTHTIFTSHPAGPAGAGINLSYNAGIQIFLSTKPLLAAKAATTDTSRYYFGKLRLKFSRPVKDPVISLVGLGATTNFGSKRLGFVTELELESPGNTLHKLSGNKQMVLDTTQTKVLHSKSPITGDCGSGAACGSVMVTGQEITTLAFRVYLRSDGGSGSWGTQKVTNAGDMWHITVSLAEQ